MARSAFDAGEREIASVYLDSTEDEMPTLAIVPEAILARRDLSPGGKILFAAIYTAALRDPDRRCRFSNAMLTQSTGLSHKQVQRLLDTLQGSGLIIREMPDPGHRAAIQIVEPERGWDDMTIPTGTICTTPSVFREHFDAIRSEEIRRPIRGKIRRREPGPDSAP
jgi:hypothetical protein